MHNFESLLTVFQEKFNTRFFSKHPDSLYQPVEYFLQIGGKRLRPVLCLMGNELFDTIHPDSFQLGMAVELFHNFTLIHDDIMDQSLLRRGMPTVHKKYDTNTAILSGDVMLIKSYDYLDQIRPTYLQKILYLFNKTAIEVCEGQQLDMDFEKMNTVSLEDYIEMISLKTAVLLGAALEMGAIIGGASEGNRKHLYNFGKNLGIAFQIRDDYLDSFGDEHIVGKAIGGDIKQNKKTALWIQTLAMATTAEKADIQRMIEKNDPKKVEKILGLYKSLQIDKWAIQLQQAYMDKAYQHLEAIAVTALRKQPLRALANFLMDRKS